MPHAWRVPPRAHGHETAEATETALAMMLARAPVVLTRYDTDGTILDVGQTQRLVTSAIWVALVLRDQHCAFPGCRRPPVMCHAHHAVHWVDGGPTSLDNLVLLCGTHHRIIHGTPWAVRLSREDRRPEFRPPDQDDWIRERSSLDPPPDERGRPPDG